MQTGAVIVAAGMSSRMGTFKPMLNIGSISIAQRIIATLQQSGISKIVMVTGYNASALEHHLANHGVIFLRNDQFKTTEMFDSAKIGLEYLKDKCERILFTPVDIPLFTQSTVEALTSSSASFAFPVCDGRSGHPILISSALVDQISSYVGEEGLKGALKSCHTSFQKIPVDDKGILYDADTPEDYKTLLEFHNQHLIRPVLQLSLARESEFFDNRLSMLLSLVDETGSVRTACQRMHISYSTSWNMIRKLESQLSMTLIERTQGGSGGGKSALTPKGKKFLESYELYNEKLRALSVDLFDKYFKDIF